MSLPRLPILVRLFIFLDQWRLRLNRLFCAFRDELLWSSVRPVDRHKINETLYSREVGYLPGGKYYQHGLFDWEIRALTRPPFPQSGLILLGAAGGGREIEGISALGYSILAFEPTSALFEGAKEVSKKCMDCNIVQASYADLIAAARFRSGPLVVPLSKVSIAAVVLGWGSFSCLLSVAERLDLLRTVRQIAPEAPVLLSFLALPLPPIATAERIRLFLQRSLRLFSRKHDHTIQDVFFTGGGFTHLYTEPEIADLASQSKYGVVHLSQIPYPHAVLKPLA
jgi:hypothetical protein